jgi:hypothetical protein
MQQLPLLLSQQMAQVHRTIKVPRAIQTSIIYRFLPTTCTGASNAKISGSGFTFWEFLRLGIAPRFAESLSLGHFVALTSLVLSFCYARGKTAVQNKRLSIRLF